jgi:uncharacterized protein YdeI (YjbR/CyaY-like superfamily)
MPPVIVDPAKVRTFKNASAFHKWLSVHHDKADEIWIRIYKVKSGVKSITSKRSNRRVPLLGLDRRGAQRL